MLLDIREKVRESKPIKYTLITLISIPFALVGIGSYFSGRSAAPVAEVNGIEITPEQLENAYNQQRTRLSQMFGGTIPEGFANEDMLRQQALDQLIGEQVLRSEVENSRFAISDETLASAIADVPVFQLDGRFDTETYRRQLQSAGMSVPGFEASFRESTAIAQFQAGVVDTSFSLPSESARVDALRSQRRTVDIVRFDLAAAMEEVEISDEDIQAWYDENADDYQFPQRAKIDYILLDSSQLADAIDVSDEEAQTYYEENRARYMTAELREASHILLAMDDPDDAEELAEKSAALDAVRERLAAGEAFADLAKEVSDDVGSAEAGGSLGAISPGLMVPEFEEAVYALDAVGDVSDVVKTDFGVHLIRVDAIKPESGKSFDEVRDEVVAAVQAEGADREFFELREALNEAAYDSPDDLGAASEATGLEVVRSDWIDSESDNGPVLSQPAVLQAVFSDEVLDEGINSELIELGPRQALVLRVAEHEGPRPKTLDDVRDSIEESLRRERASDSLDELVEAALGAFANGDDAETIAGTSPLATAETGVDTDRQGSGQLDRAVVSALFELPKPAADGAAVTGSAQANNGDRLAMRLVAINAETESTDAEGGTDEASGEGDTTEPAPVIANARLGNTEFSAMMESLRDRADIELAE